MCSALAAHRGTHNRLDLAAELGVHGCAYEGIERRGERIQNLGPYAPLPASRPVSSHGKHGRPAQLALHRRTHQVLLRARMLIKACQGD